MVIVLFYSGLACFVLNLLSLYRVVSKPDVGSFLLSTPGYLFLGSGCGLLLVLVWGARMFSQCPPDERRRQLAALSFNLLAVVAIAVSLEALIRNKAVDTPAGLKLAGTMLYPRNWTEVVERHRDVLDRMAREESYMVQDPELGWTIAPNRRNSTELYASSREGLRSPQPGYSFLDPLTRVTGTASRPPVYRLALVGDSMTFADEVRCEDSWGHRVEQALGSDAQVLNFGVNGYSVIQAVERYRRLGRQWRPDVVVLGVTSETLVRMQSIYNFLIYPEAIQMPYARPRPVLQDDGVVFLNRPVPTAAQIFSSPTVHQLPWIQSDRFYNIQQWERANWKWIQQSYLFRLLTSLRPVAESIRVDVSDEVLVELTRRVIGSFRQEVERSGATFVVVHLPYQWDLRDQLDGKVLFAVRMLRQAGVDFHDLSPCLLDAGAVNGFVSTGNHYNASGNEVVARCITGILRQVLREPSQLRKATRSPYNVGN